MFDPKQFFKKHGLSGDETIKIMKAPPESEKPVPTYVKLKELCVDYAEAAAHKEEPS